MGVRPMVCQGVLCHGPGKTLQSNTHRLSCSQCLYLLDSCNVSKDARRASFGVAINNIQHSDISQGLQLVKPEPEGNISADCTHTHRERKRERERGNGVRADKSSE
ncbi:unnamed protein product [Dovyalis caffra]|uniref:Uncharacterized protein n=1 Tax=Dovyalis caffra TaxID=77055 RepID=A0AAV1RKL4_9ROSI|nr:unnamed protein product [Dovyalis caffra]